MHRLDMILRFLVNSVKYLIYNIFDQIRNQLASSLCSDPGVCQLYCNGSPGFSFDLIFAISVFCKCLFMIYHFETQSNVGGYLGLYLGVSLIQVRIQGITLSRQKSCPTLHLSSLRYESSTLILYKELSSTIFQSCQSVRHA